MRKLLMTIVLVFCCQVAIAQDVTESPASKQDVLRLQREIQRLRREAREAEAKIVARSETEGAARDRLARESQSAISDAERKLAQIQSAIASEARLSSEERLRQRRTVWWSVFFIAAAMSAVFLVWVFRKDRSQTVPGRMALTLPERMEMGMIKNPDVPTLKKISAANGGIKIIPFLLELEEGQLYCEADLNVPEGALPLVHFRGVSKPVAWEHRKVRGGETLASQNRSQEKI